MPEKDKNDSRTDSDPPIDWRRVYYLQTVGELDQIVGKSSDEFRKSMEGVIEKAGPATQEAARALLAFTEAEVARKNEQMFKDWKEGFERIQERFAQVPESVPLIEPLPKSIPIIQPPTSPLRRALGTLRKVARTILPPYRR